MARCGRQRRHDEEHDRAAAERDADRHRPAVLRAELGAEPVGEHAADGHSENADELVS